MAISNPAGPSLAGRSILVTGGGSGIGRAVAMRVAETGAAVTVTDIDEKQAARVANEIVEAGGRAQALRLDVAQPDENEAAVAAAVSAFGHLDGACNAAGLQPQGAPLHEIDVAQWDRINAVNNRGVFLSMRAQVPAMLAAGGGSIVNIASTAAIAGIPNGADYCASKGAVAAATRGAALDYAKLGIRVNAVLPGATRTPMLKSVLDLGEDMERIVIANSPMGRIADPDEIAYAVRWLLSAEASYVTGHLMPVDGGLTTA